MLRAGSRQSTVTAGPAPARHDTHAKRGQRGDISFAYSLAFLVGLPAMVVMGWLGGALYDASGDYTWSIRVAAVIGYLALPLALYLPRHGKPGTVASRAARPAA